MNYKISIFFLSVSFFVGSLVVYTILHKKSVATHSVMRNETKPRVVCTTTFIGDLARNIAGDELAIVTLMQPGIDPHTYKAQPQDVVALTQADRVLFHGLALEGKMADVLEKLPHAYAVTDVISQEKLLCVDEFFRIYDPHIWFDPLLWARVACGIGEQFALMQPESRELFTVRAAAIAEELHLLDAHIREKVLVLSSDKKILVTAHDAFGYFGKAYGFVVRGLQGLSTEAEISVRDIADLADFIVHNTVSVMFGETSVSRKALEAVQEAVAAQGGRVVLGPDICSDSLGSDAESATYQSMMKQFVDMITRYSASGVS